MLEDKTKIPITFRLALLYLCVYFMPVDCVILGRKCNTCGLLKQVVCDVQGFPWVSAAESSVCIEPSWFVFKEKMKFVVLLKITRASMKKKIQCCLPGTADARLHFTHCIPELSWCAKESRRYNETVKALPGKAVMRSITCEAGSAPIC